MRRLRDLLTAEEHVLLFGAAAGLSCSHARTTGIALLDSFGFPTGENAVARDLSGGARQTLNLVLAAHTPVNYLQQVATRSLRSSSLHLRR